MNSSISSILLKIIRFGQIFSLIPIVNSNVVAKRSITVQIYGCLFLAAFGALAVMLIIEPKPEMNSINRLVNNFQIGCYGATAILTLLESWFSCYKYRVFKNYILKLDQQLSLTRNQAINYDIINKTINTAAILTFLVLVYFGCVDFYVMIHILSNSVLRWTVMYLATVIYVASIVQLFQFSFLLYIQLKACSEFIESGPRISESMKKFGQSDLIDVDNILLETKRHSFFVISAFHNLNSMYSLQLTASTGTSLIIITVLLFYSVTQPFDGLTFLAYANRMGLHALTVLLNVFLFSFIEFEWNKIQQMLYGIFTKQKDAVIAEKASTLILLLQSFSLKFSAAKFFDIDATLLQTMIGAITTYIIILVQFRSSKTSDGDIFDIRLEPSLTNTAH